MTKRFCRLLVLLFITAVCCVFFLIFPPNLRDSLPDNGENDVVVLDFELDNLSYIHLKPQMEDGFSFQKLGSGNWGVLGYDYPLDQAKVGRILQIISNFKVHLLPGAQSDLSIYGLSSPSLILEVDFVHGEKRIIMFGGSSVVGEKVYLQVDGDSQVYFLAKEERGIFLDSLDDYWDLFLPRFDWENISYMQFETLGNKIELKAMEISDESSLHTFINPDRYQGLFVDPELYKALWNPWIKDPLYKKERLKVKINAWGVFGLDVPVLRFFLKDKNNNEIRLSIGMPVMNEEGYRFARLDDEDAVFIINEDYVKSFFRLKSSDLVNKSILNSILKKEVSFFVLEGSKMDSLPFIGQIIDTEKVHEDPFVWNNFILNHHQNKIIPISDEKLQNDVRRFDYRVNGHSVDHILFSDLYTKLKSLRYEKDGMNDGNCFSGSSLPVLRILFYENDIKMVRKIEFKFYDQFYYCVILDGRLFNFKVPYKQVLSIIQSAQKILNVERTR